MTSSRFSTFLIIWFGELISSIGSGFTGFAVGIWLYAQSGSVTLLALSTLASMLPNVFLSLFAGTLVDRGNRRAMMLFGNLGAAICIAILSWVVLAKPVPMVWVYALLVLAGICGTFQKLAFTSCVPFLVPAARLGQANGLVQLIQAGSALVSPLVAATLLSVAYIQMVLWADVGTFLFGILTLLVTPFSETKDESSTPLDASHVTSTSTSLWQQSQEGLRHFGSNSRLMVLVSQTMMGALIFGCLSVLSQPLVLSFASTQSLAVVMSLGGVAMLVGSILMAVWGGPKNRGLGLLVGGLVCGVCVIAIAFTTQFALFTAIACLFFATLPVMNSLTYTLLQHHVIPAMLGRAMAVLQSASYAASIISYLLAGTLADRIFEPAMMAEGALSRWAGPYLGVGNGRGIALMCVMLGLLLLISALISYRYRLDREWASMPSAR